MDNENNETPYEQMDDVGVKPTILGKTLHILSSKKIIPTIRNHLQR